MSGLDTTSAETHGPPARVRREGNSPSFCVLAGSGGPLGRPDGIRAVLDWLN